MGIYKSLTETGMKHINILQIRICHFHFRFKYVWLRSLSSLEIILLVLCIPILWGPCNAVLQCKKQKHLRRMGLIIGLVSGLSSIFIISGWVGPLAAVWWPDDFVWLENYHALRTGILSSFDGWRLSAQCAHIISYICNHYHSYTCTLVNCALYKDVLRQTVLITNI